MKVKSWKRERMVRIGIGISPTEADDNINEFFLDDRNFRLYSQVPVTWYGNAATMFYTAHNAEHEPVNRTAMSLLPHSAPLIYGQIYLTRDFGKMFKLRTRRTADEVNDAIENLGLSGDPVMGFSDKHKRYTYVYARTRDDIFAIRMCI